MNIEEIYKRLNILDKKFKVSEFIEKVESDDDLILKIGDIEKTPICPICGGEDVRVTKVPCRCCDDKKSCWTAPHCNKCGHTGAGNSTGGLWFMPSYWR